MAHKLNVITAVLVLILFGTVCSSYAIDCMDLWDEEALAEMEEADKRYEEQLKARQLEEDAQCCNERDSDEDDGVNDDDVHDDDDDDEDENHEEHGNEEDAHAGHAAEHEEDEAGDGDEQYHGEDLEASMPRTEARHKRQLALTAEQWPAVSPIERDPSADLEAAETHLFRPVFRYKSQYTERRRVRDNFTPSRQ